jgi:cytochrome c553
MLQSLRTGKKRFSNVTGSMQAVVSHSTSRLSDDDLAATATYLKSLPQAPQPTPTQPSTQEMAAGKSIFMQR